MTDTTRPKPDIQAQLSAVPVQTHWGICDPNFVYHNSASTDVTRTWRKFGWTPINEQESNDETICPKN